jgi:hypothetical protein
MTSDKLQTELLDKVFLSDRNGWTHSKIEDLSNLAASVFEVFPKDAKTIGEVESFTVDEEVLGSIFYTFKRKIKE